MLRPLVSLSFYKSVPLSVLRFIVSPLFFSFLETETHPSFSLNNLILLKEEELTHLDAVECKTIVGIMKGNT